MTKDQLEAKVGKIEKAQDALGDLEELLQDVTGVEEAQGIRDVLLTAKLSLHATRMAVMVGVQKLRVVVPRPAEKAA